MTNMFLILTFSGVHMQANRGECNTFFALALWLIKLIRVATLEVSKAN